MPDRWLCDAKREGCGEYDASSESVHDLLQRWMRTIPRSLRIGNGLLHDQNIVPSTRLQLQVGFLNRFEGSIDVHLALLDAALVTNNMQLAYPAVVFTPVSRKADNDGLLHPAEIEGLRILSDLVVLSACETAAGNGLPGAEALSGLAQAFLYAGTRRVLATQWKVESRAAARLVGDAAGGLTAGDLARHLNRAMARLKSNASTRHPAYWAPYVLFENSLD